MAWTRENNTDASWTTSDPQIDIFDGRIFDFDVFDATVSLWTTGAQINSNWAEVTSEQTDTFDARLFDTLVFDATADAWAVVGDGVSDWIKQ